MDDSNNYSVSGIQIDGESFVDEIADIIIEKGVVDGVSAGDGLSETTSNNVKTLSVDNTVARRQEDNQFDNVVITGNLTVQGEEHIIETDTYEVKDGIVLYNKDQTVANPNVDVGFEALEKRDNGAGDEIKTKGIISKAGTDKFTIFSNANESITSLEQPFDLGSLSVRDAVANDEPATKGQMDTKFNDYLPRTGGTMNGNLVMGAQDITALDTLSFTNGLGNKLRLIGDDNYALFIDTNTVGIRTNDIFKVQYQNTDVIRTDSTQNVYIENGSLSMGGNQILNVANPSNGNSALNLGTGEARYARLNFNNSLRGLQTLSRLNPGPQDLLRFETDRPWKFRTDNVGSGTELELYSETAAKGFKITSASSGGDINIARFHGTEGIDMFQDVDYNQNNINNLNYVQTNDVLFTRDDSVYAADIGFDNANKLIMKNFSGANFAQIAFQTARNGGTHAGTLDRMVVNSDSIDFTNLTDLNINTNVDNLSIDVNNLTITGNTIDITDEVDMNSNKLINVGDATNNGDALNLGVADAKYVKLNEDNTLTGELTISNQIAGEQDLLRFDTQRQWKFRTNNNAGATFLELYSEVDQKTFKISSNTDSGDTDIVAFNSLEVNMFKDMNMNNNKIENVAEPTNNQDVATKNYVDNATGGLNADKYRTGHQRVTSSSFVSTQLQNLTGGWNDFELNAAASGKYLVTCYIRGSLSGGDPTHAPQLSLRVGATNVTIANTTAFYAPIANDPATNSYINTQISHVLDVPIAVGQNFLSTVLQINTRSRSLTFEVIYTCKFLE